MTSSLGLFGRRLALFSSNVMELRAMRLFALRLAIFGKDHVTWPVRSRRWRWWGPDQALDGESNKPLCDGHELDIITVSFGVSGSEVLRI